MAINKFRLIHEAALSGSVNMAKDHAILYGVSHNELLPTLRIARWTGSTVTIGNLEDVNSTVNIDYCKKNNIPIIRRDTGGGTVLHNTEFSYSFTIPLDSYLIPGSVDESFRKLMAPLINTLEMYIDGVEYRPVNDIVIKKRKISGNAQVRKYGVLHQHGTVIIDINDEIFASAIYYDEYKLKSRGFSSLRESLTSLKDELGRDIDEKFIKEFETALINSFAKEFDIDFVNSDITDSEKNVMDELLKKFDSDEWNLQ